jgi:hypothetical protein
LISRIEDAAAAAASTPLAPSDADGSVLQAVRGLNRQRLRALRAEEGRLGRRIEALAGSRVTA